MRRMVVLLGEGAARHRPKPPVDPASGVTTEHAAFEIPVMTGGAENASFRDLMAAHEPPAHKKKRETLVEWPLQKPDAHVSKTDAAAAQELKTRLLTDRAKDPVTECRKLEEGNYKIGPLTLTTVLSILKRQDRLREAATLCDRLVARHKADFSSTSGHNNNRTHMWDVVASVYAQARHTRKLSAMLRRIKPSLPVMNEVCRALAEQGTTVLPLFQKMATDRVTPDEIMFRTVISKHPDKEERAELRRLMRKLNVPVTSERGHAMLLHEASKRGDGDAAEEGFRRLANYLNRTPDEKNWTMLLQSHASSGDLLRTLDVLRRMDEQCVPVSCRSKSMLLHCYARHIPTAHESTFPQLVADAERVFAEGEASASFRTDAKFFVSALVSCYAAAGLPGKARELAARVTPQYGLTVDLRALANSRRPPSPPKARSRGRAGSHPSEEEKLDAGVNHA